MNSLAFDQHTAGTQLNNINRELKLMGCQVSPLVLKIRDNGPALLDGECSAENTLLLSGKGAANSPDSGVIEHSASRRLRRRLTTMVVSTLLLTLSLVCVGAYAWKQKTQVNELEAELALLKAAEQEQY